MRRLTVITSLAVAFCSAGAAEGRGAQSRLSLQGTWLMEAAYEIQADGAQTRAYGQHPAGLMMVDRSGRYGIQIYRPDLEPFKAASKADASPGELRAAALSSSTHFGRVAIDPKARQLVFQVDAAFFPNWKGKTQRRDYTFTNGVLTYRVPASASGNGSVAVSVWRKVADR